MGRRRARGRGKAKSKRSDLRVVGLAVSGRGAGVVQTAVYANLSE